jgi:Ca2+-transporting ATPase
VLTNEARVALTADGLQIQGDPTEAAMLIAGMRVGIEPDVVQEHYSMIAEVPFEPQLQFSASLRTHGDERHLFVKGAPERVLAMCEDMLEARGEVVPLNRELIVDAAHEMAAAGLRVLSMAYEAESHASRKAQDLETPAGLTFIGLQGLADPPSGGARQAISACREAGIRVLMITGDHAATARAIGHELGINNKQAAVVTGPGLEEMGEDELAQVVAKVDIFARVEPKHKLRIVRALQDQDEVVAVTGDGVNDAPALRAADIGIAMGKRGTDVAKEAADMVLADDNFVSIAAAVEEGRITFSNVRKVVFFLFSANGAEVLTILVALLFGWPLPLIAAQILWLNLVTDTLPVVALAFEPGEPWVMNRKPRGRHAGVLNRRLWERLALSSVVMTIGTLALFRWELDRSGSEASAQTMALSVMVFYQMFQAINARSEKQSIFRLNPLANRFLFFAITGSIAIHVVALYLGPTQYLLRVEPISLGSWLLVILVASTILAVVEVHKLIRRGNDD